MSLLLCFFVMLYAMSTLQVPKMQAAVESFRGGLGVSGMATAKDQNPKQEQPQEQQEQEQQEQEQQEQEQQGQEQQGQGNWTITVPQGNKARFQTTYSDEKSVKGGIIRFAVNSDELDEETKRRLNLLIEELSGLPFKILITGHAEPNEQGTYRHAMDLSYSRAVNVWRYLVSKGMNQNDFRIHAAGFSEPVEVEAEEKDSHDANRCVDIKIIANTPRNTMLPQNKKKNAGTNLKYLRF